MSKYVTIVSYDNNEPDIPCVICARQENGTQSICVGYTLHNADELQKIVTEQGYLEVHDRNIINKYIDKVKEDVSARLKARKHYLTDYEYEYEVEITRNLISALDYFAKQLKEQKNENV